MAWQGSYVSVLRLPYAGARCVIRGTDWRRDGRKKVVLRKQYCSSEVAKEQLKASHFWYPGDALLDEVVKPLAY